MLWTREEYLDMMTFRGQKQPMFVELFGPLIGLEDEWRAQGASEDEIGMTAFGFDMVKTVDCGGNCLPIHQLTPVLLEETDEYRLMRDEFGRTSRMMKGRSTLPLPSDWPVADENDWKKIRHMFEYDPCRIDRAAAERAREMQKQGDENCCYAFYEQPELLRDMLALFAETSCRVLKEISSIVTVDNLCIHEDMAGKGGPLIGPNLVREFLKPYYRAVWDVASSNGCRLFSQDSDGDMNPVIEAFIECGVNVFYPCEPAAGMDVVALRKKYGHQIAFKGGIDKHVLRGTKEDIDRELEYKLQPIMREGGMVFGLDHRIPNGTPLENYRYYVRRAREILGLGEITEPMWARMAF